MQTPSVAAPPPDEGVAPPYFSVQLQLLEACNLRCTHCYMAEHPGRSPSTEEIKRRIDRIDAFGVVEGVKPDFHLSGGEPTLRKDLAEIITYITERGGDPLLFSNGTRWTPELTDALASAGLRYVQVSLEGAEATNDAVRGEGVYSEAMRTLEMLRARDFLLTVSITVTAGTADETPRFIAESLDPLGVHVHMREVLPVGGGVDLPSPTPAQRRALFEWAIAWSGTSTVGIEDPIHCSVSPRYARDRRGCVAGRNHFCVDIDGKVYPCRALRYAVGHVDDLSSAWHSPTMERLRRRELGGQCGRCELRPHCGGCRVFALADGDLFGEDTRCFADEHGLVRTPFEDRVVRTAETVGRMIGRARALGRDAIEAGRRRLPIVRGP